MGVSLGPAIAFFLVLFIKMQIPFIYIDPSFCAVVPDFKTVKGIRWIAKTGNIHLSQIIILKIRKKCCYPLKIIIVF